MKRTLSVTAVAALLLGAVALPTQAADPVQVPQLVKDIYTGTTSSFAPWSEADGPRSATLGSTTLFAASSSGLGNELWASDGTPAGTRLIKDIWPGTTSSAPKSLTSLAGKVYFSAEGQDGKGVEVWSSDGTTAGTVRVTDLNPGAGDSDPEDFVVAGGALHFSVKTTENTRALYRLDSSGTTGKLTSSGIKDVSEVAAWGNKVVFAGKTVAEGTEPWVSDGTFGGTHMLGNINTGAADSAPTQFTALSDGDVLFSASDATHGTELWTSNGTVTQQLRDLDLGAPDGNPTDLFAVNGKAYFGAKTAASPYTIWVTDGTGVGTQQLASLVRAGGNSGNPADFTAHNGLVYFAASEVNHGSELWRTNGTPVGTYMVRDIKVGGPNSAPRDLTVVDGQLYLSADDAAGLGRLWRSDGTTAGTVPVASSVEPTTTRVLSVIGNTLFLAGKSAAEGQELWSYTTRAAPATAPAPAVVRRATSVKAYPKHAYSRSTAKKKQIKLTVKVRATGMTPGGKIVLKKGSKIVGKGTLKKGTAKVRITKKLGKGTTKVRAYYSGSATTTPSRSGVIKVRVK